jgi:3-phosphoshikimate 1-carboxyvinyltransferase
VRLRVRPANRLTGRAEVPGDKSISHRAALLGGIAQGVTEIHGYLEAEDCLRSLAAIEALGVEVTRKGPGEYRIAGAGLRGLCEPGDVIDCGNSGTTARLLLGILAGQPFWTMLTGDESLRRRPMGRVAEPLRRMGATVVGRADGARLPLAVRGADRLTAIDYLLPVASAQLKSALLLAGLYAGGPVTVREPAVSRDHSERMLRRFGVLVETTDGMVRLTPSELTGTTLRVPGDLSSAAFLLAAALVVPGSRVTVAGVGLNPTRTGLLDVLGEMGARLVVTPEERPGAPVEPRGSIGAETSELRGTRIAGALIPRLIDEVPVLAVVAAVAEGRTEIRDAAELRVKESDRIAMLARGLGAMGVRVSELPDGLAIDGGARLRGARVASGGDHRLAMALAVAGLAAEGETVVEDTACIDTSFPSFAETVNALTGEPSLVSEV